MPEVRTWGRLERGRRIFAIFAILWPHSQRCDLYKKSQNCGAILAEFEAHNFGHIQQILQSTVAHFSAAPKYVLPVFGWLGDAVLKLGEGNNHWEPHLQREPCLSEPIWLIPVALGGTLECPEYARGEPKVINTCAADRPKCC